MNITEWVTRVHATAVEHGWYEEDAAKARSFASFWSPNFILAKLALIHTEISEATEVVRVGVSLTTIDHDREGKPDGFGVELADAVIRIMDLAGALGIDLERCMVEKAAFNQTRPHRHGGKRA